MRSRVHGFGLAVVALALIGSPPAWCQQTDNTAQLYVRVEDHGKAVPGLEAKHFRVSEGGRPQLVQEAKPAGAASVVLLVENSDASWKYLAEVNSAMSGFLKSAPPWHSYTLVSYSQDPAVEEPLTMDARKVVTAYVSRKQSAVSHVAAYDALDRALDSTEKLSGLRVVIMIGSGEDEFSRTGFRDVLERAEASNVVIYSIQLGGSLAATAATLPSGFEDLEEELRLGKRSQGDVPDLARGEMFLRAVARRTGGDFYCPNCGAGYRTSVEQIIDSLDKYYRLTYTRRTEPEPGFAKLRVQAFRLDDDVRTDFDVKARQGWRF